MLTYVDNKAFRFPEILSAFTDACFHWADM